MTHAALRRLTDSTMQIMGRQQLQDLHADRRITLKRIPALLCYLHTRTTR
jgi:hypothetical protein